MKLYQRWLRYVLRLLAIGYCGHILFHMDYFRLFVMLSGVALMTVILNRVFLWMFSEKK